ncbi:MAG TPA: ComEC/Rec2 family competence protein [Flavobacteriales bacterium]|nr:ComEC/Rec2 family competence protein [Flavobacteriales bacterium]
MKNKYVFPGTSFWANQPMSRLVILLILGCIVGFNIDHQSNIHYWEISLVCIWLTFSSLLFVPIRKPKLIRTISLLRGCLILVFFVLSGILGVMLIPSPVDLPNRESTLINRSYFFLVQVEDEPKSKQDRISFTASLEYAYGYQKFYLLHSKTKIQIHHTQPLHIRYGDQLILNGELHHIPKYANPNLFNYSKFLKSKGVFSTLTCNQADLIFLSYHGFSILRTALNWRDKLLVHLDEAIMGKTSKQVASALLLGDRTEMDSDILQLYSSGGIIHILAVSGLHVGLIYQALIYLFSLIPFLSKKRVTTIFILLLLWAYAAMTGFSPSVNRAVAMFTLIAIGEILQRRVSGFNILSTAAFFLLVFKPHLITDIGFQLSFAAVWGILSIRPVLDRLKLSNSRIIRWMGVPIVVSIAAQITTAPFVFFSFGTFPVWFLPANIIAVPLSTLLTYLGIITLLLSEIPVLGFFLLKTLGWGIELLNSWAYFIAHLPFAQIVNLYIDVIQLILLIISIVLFFLLVKKRSGKRYISLGIFVFILLIYSALLGFYKEPVQERILYSSRYSLFYQVNRRESSDIYVIYSSELMRIETRKYYSDIWRNLSFNRSTRIHPIPFENDMESGINGLLIDTNHSIRPLNDSSRLSKPTYIVSEKVLVDTSSFINSSRWDNLIWIPAPWISKRAKVEYYQSAIKNGMETSNFVDTGYLVLQ